MSTQFDWSDKTHQPVHEQMATAIYFNADGHVVVRQRDFFGDDDVFIVLTPDNAVRLAHAMLRLVGGETETAASTPAPKDPTAVARQRRHRDKHRDTDRDSQAETVTTERDDTDQQPLALKLVASK